MALDITKALGQFQKQRGFYVVGTDIVTHAIGHLLGQAEPEAYGEQYGKTVAWTFDNLPIIPQAWKLFAYPKVRAQLDVILNLLEKADSVVHCGDAAREGQLIVDEILRYAKYKGPVQRLWLHSMTRDGIRTSMKQMKDNQAYLNLYRGAVSRSRADWLTGMNLTRAFSIPWRAAGNQGAIHIGRVKTPTLGFVVERERAIIGFKPHDYYTLEIEVKTTKGEVFWAHWIVQKEAPYLDQSGHIIDREILQMVADWVSDEEAKIESCKTEEKSSPPPLPMTLGDLQKAANVKLGLTPAQTLEIAQRLYEEYKLISYPRTDYNFLPEEEFPLSETWITASKENFGEHWPFEGVPDFKLKSRAWNSSKIGDHYGLRPTEVIGIPIIGLTKMEQAVYTLVVRNFLAQFYPHYRYDVTIVEVLVEGESFEARGQIERDPGWRVLFRGETSEQDNHPPLPPVSAGDTGSVSNVRLQTKTTSPPIRYTGATLLDAMEKAHLHISDETLKETLKGAGIGTPATRSNIIEELVDSDYLQTDRKVYRPTKKALQLYDAVPNSLRKPDSTALIEDALKRIEDGEMDPVKFLESHVAQVKNMIEEAKKAQYKLYSKNQAPNCPKCGAIMAKREDKGKLVWMCTTYPVCKGKSKFEDKPNGDKKAAKGDPNAPPCPKCGGAMRQRTGANGAFWGCVNYPECKGTQNIRSAENKPENPDPNAPACPKCGGSMRQRNGSKGAFWGCQKYPECNGIINIANMVDSQKEQPPKAVLPYKRTLLGYVLYVESSKNAQGHSFQATGLAKMSPEDLHACIHANPDPHSFATHELWKFADGEEMLYDLKSKAAGVI